MVPDGAEKSGPEGLQKESRETRKDPHPFGWGPARALHARAGTPTSANACFRNDGCSLSAAEGVRDRVRLTHPIVEMGDQAADFPDFEDPG